MSLGVERRLRALANPQRLRILSMARGQEVSAAEVARELRVAHASASYHLRQLAEAGFLRAVGQRKLRGGIENRYALAPDAFEGLETSDPLLEQAMLAELTRRLSRREPNRLSLLSDGEAWIPAAKWEVLVARLRTVLEDAAAAAQPTGTAGAVHVNVSAFVFEIGDGSEP